MRAVKRLVYAVILLVAVAIGAAYLLPREVSVSRSVSIDAPPEAVFPHVNSLQQFAEWSPWADYDPEMTQSFEGPESGVGNRMVWQSTNQSVGSGIQEIVESVENRRVATTLDFGAMGTAAASFDLEPAGGGTTVTWGFTGDMGMNPLGRYMGLMMDRWVGADYEKGLARLKARVEGG